MTDNYTSTLIYTHTLNDLNKNHFARLGQRKCDLKDIFGQAVSYTLLLQHYHEEN